MKIKDEREKESLELRCFLPGRCFILDQDYCMRLNVTRGENLGYVVLTTGKVYYTGANAKVVPVEIKGVISNANA